MMLNRKAVVVSLVVLGAIIALAPMAGASSSVVAGSAVASWDVPAVDALSVKATTPPAVTETALLEALEDGFDDIDTNGDGQVSLAEAQAALPGLTPAVFALVDTNGDGQISADEAGVGGCHGCVGGFLKHLGEVFMAALAMIAMTLLGIFWNGDTHTQPTIP